MEALTYEERYAVDVLRKAIRKKPEIIELLVREQSKELANRVLTQVRDELTLLLEVNRAFSAAAAKLAKQEPGVPAE
jgi:hypothetical protein